MCKGYYWRVALASSHLSKMLESLLISFSSCDMSLLTTSDFIRLNSSTYLSWGGHVIHVLGRHHRKCMAMIWRTSLKESTSLICDDLYAPSLFNWKNSLQSWRTKIRNMACGCGAGCFAGTSKNKYFKSYYGLTLWWNPGITEVKGSSAVVLNEGRILLGVCKRYVQFSTVPS